MGSVDEAMEEVVTRRALVHLFVEESLQRACLYLACRSGEDNTLALLDVHLEISGNIEVLIRCISTFLLLRILHAAIPVGHEYKLVLL